ncbi:MAG: F0F1 ATP synthase subunit epsilon [Candidatus Hydrogenedentota bacterium]
MSEQSNTMGLATVRLEIVAPERAVMQMDVQEAIIPGVEGLFTVMPGHTPFFTMTRPGAVAAVDPKGEEHFFAVTDGFVEVLEDHITLLPFTAEHEEEIDRDRAEAAKSRAQRRLREREENIDYARAESALDRAHARLQAHSRLHY